MGLKVSYKNSLGAVVMSGNGETPFRITALEGFGPVGREFETAVYSGSDGQETLNSRATARTLTIGLEVCCENIVRAVEEAVAVFAETVKLGVNAV